MKKRKTNKNKQIDKSCSNHGTCCYCTRNRLYQATKELEKVKSKENEYLVKIDETCDER